VTCDRLDNSLSSSPKNLFDESRFSSQNKEFYVNTDDELILNSSPEDILDHNKTIDPRSGKTHDLETCKANEKSTKLWTFRNKSIFNQRRMTENLETGRKILETKKKGCESDNEDPYFVSNSFKGSKLSAKDLINTINAFEACDNVGFLCKTYHDYSKDNLMKKLKANHQKNQKFIISSKKKHIPALRITNSVLTNRIFR